MIVGYWIELPNWDKSELVALSCPKLNIKFQILIKKAALLMALFTKRNSDKRTGIYSIGSSYLPIICHLRRSKRHHTLATVAEYGNTSVSWSFGLKLHLVVNHLGQLIAFKVTKAQRHNRNQAKSLLASLQDLAFGDKLWLR